MAKYEKGEFTTVPSKSARSGLSPTLQVVYMWLCDYTDNNDECYPSRTTLAENCGISKPTLDRALTELEKIGLIQKKARFNNNTQTSNLYTVQIIESKSEAGGVKYEAPPHQKPHTELNPDNSTQITQSITSVIGDTPVAYGNDDINEMFECWEATIGYKIESNRQRNRNACNNLIKKYGIAGLKQLINAVQVAQNDKYAPRVSDFMSLQSKLNDLLAWAKKKGTTQNATAQF